MTEPTARQVAVLVAYIECGRTQEAAARLGVHPDTLRHWLAEIATVLGARNTAQAIAIAIRRGLIDAQELQLPDAA